MSEPNSSDVNYSQSNLILVAGATGGVGQLVVAKLLAQNYSVRILTRNEDKARNMFGDRVEIKVGNILEPATFNEPDALGEALQGVSQLICCTGTTAFPSLRWDFTNLWQPINTPRAVDGEGIKNLVTAASSDLARFVFVSSCGVLRKDKFPFKLLNAFGVLDAKLEGEQAIKNSGIPYTIIRPGRLIDGPFTSYDLNTLFQAKTDGKKAVVLGTKDTLNGETSRIDVANACVECLNYTTTINQTFELVNIGNKSTPTNWEQLFAQL